jgi:hypothetical protein
MKGTMYMLCKRIFGFLVRSRSLKSGNAQEGAVYRARGCLPIHRSQYLNQEVFNVNANFAAACFRHFAAASLALTISECGCLSVSPYAEQ